MSSTMENLGNAIRQGRLSDAAALLERGGTIDSVTMGVVAREFRSLVEGREYELREPRCGAPSRIIQEVTPAFLYSASSSTDSRAEIGKVGGD